MVASFRISFVRHHLIVWADRPQVIHHRRRDGDAGIDTLVVTAGEIRLDPPGVAISVEEIYAS